MPERPLTRLDSCFAAHAEPPRGLGYAQPQRLQAVLGDGKTRMGRVLHRHYSWPQSLHAPLTACFQRVAHAVVEAAVAVLPELDRNGVLRRSRPSGGDAERRGLRILFPGRAFFCFDKGAGGNHLALGRCPRAYLAAARAGGEIGVRNFCGQFFDRLLRRGPAGRGASSGIRGRLSRRARVA